MNCMGFKNEAAAMVRSFEQMKEVRRGMQPQGVDLGARNRPPRDAEPQEENKGLTDTNNSDHQATSKPRNLPKTNQRRKRVRREEESNALGIAGLEQRTANGGKTERAEYQQLTTISLLYSNPAPSQETMRVGKCIAETWRASIFSLQQDRGSLAISHTFNLTSTHVQILLISPPTMQTSDDDLYDVSDREKDRVKSWSKRKKNKRKAEEDYKD